MTGDVKSNNRVDLPLKTYQPKKIPRFTKQSVILDSAFRKVNEHDTSQRRAVHSYSSTTMQHSSRVVDCYSPGIKLETLLVHFGHNSIDEVFRASGSNSTQGNSRQKQAKIVPVNDCKNVPVAIERKQTRKYINNAIN